MSIQRSRNCYYPTCESCGIGREQCSFRRPFSQPLNLIERELKFELDRLDSIRERISLFKSVEEDIDDGVYEGQRNFFGNLILTPSDAFVDLDLNILIREESDTINIIRDLRKRENNILKVLKRRMKE